MQCGDAREQLLGEEERGHAKPSAVAREAKKAAASRVFCEGPLPFTSRKSREYWTSLMPNWTHSSKNRVISGILLLPQR